MTLTLFLLIADHFILLCQLLALFIFSFVAYKQVKVNSSLLTTLVVSLANGISTAYTPYLGHLYKTTNHKLGVDFAWYVGFTIIDITSILLIYWVHKKKNIHYGTLARLMIPAFSILGLLQIIRYSERIIWGAKSAVFKPFYTGGIISINYSTTTAIVLLSFLAIASVYYTKLTYPVTIGKRQFKWAL
jgi:hypothetical protein